MRAVIDFEENGMNGHLRCCWKRKEVAEGGVTDVPDALCGLRIVRRWIADGLCTC